MWNNTVEAVVTIAIAIVGVAFLAVVVSKKSNTAAVIQASASAFSNSLAVALTPVTGENVDINTSYPGQGGLTGTNYGVNAPGLYN